MFLDYKLALYPLGLFDDGIMRKTEKSKLCEFFQAAQVSVNDLTNNCPYVLDGGFLLHTVVWMKKTTFRELLDQYVDYVR